MNKGWLLLFLCVLSMPVVAGGPFVIEGPLGHTPVKYPDGSDVVINADQGPLGPRNNATMITLVDTAFSLWNNVTDSTVNIVQGNDLGTDVISTNYQPFLPDGTSSDPSIGDGISPLIYDSDGSIIDDYLYPGASTSVVGFASSIWFANGTEFQEGFVVLNGAIPFLDDDLILTITHEIGHVIGLDHSQIDISNTDSGCDLGPTNEARYPVMYPFTCRFTPTLHEDDATAAVILYPSATPTTARGQLQGTLTAVSGLVALGANIWVEEVSAGIGTGLIYSIVSDYLLLGTGNFSLLLPPGEYTLYANSINDQFTGGSGVGPYSSGPTDSSFQFPASMVDTYFEGSTPTPGVPQTVFVIAGESTNVTFFIDGSGSFSNGNPITDPSIPPPPPPVIPPATTSSSGWFSVFTFLLMVGLITTFRVISRKRLRW